MGRDHANDETQYLNRGATILGGGDPRPVTVSLWINPNAANTAQWYFSNGFPSTAPNWGLSNRAFAGVDQMRIFSNGAYTNSPNFTMVVNAWNHFCWTWDNDASDTVEFWHNGVSLGTGSRTQGGTAQSDSAVGSLTGTNPSFRIDGESAEFAVWDLILNDEEIEALADGMSALLVRPTSLQHYLPLIGRFSPEIDLMDSNTWTVNGSLAATAHAPIIYPNSIFIGTRVPLFGGEFHNPIFRIRKSYSQLAVR